MGSSSSSTEVLVGFWALGENTRRLCACTVSDHYVGMATRYVHDVLRFVGAEDKKT